MRRLRLFEQALDGTHGGGVGMVGGVGRARERE